MRVLDDPLPSRDQREMALIGGWVASPVGTYATTKYFVGFAQGQMDGRACYVAGEVHATTGAAMCHRSTDTYYATVQRYNISIYECVTPFSNQYVQQ